VDRGGCVVRVCPVAKGGGGTGTSISGPRPSPASVPSLCVGFVTFDRCPVQPHMELDGSIGQCCCAGLLVAVRYGRARARPTFPTSVFHPVRLDWHRLARDVDTGWVSFTDGAAAG
jgi:hypothetical protein